MIISAWIKYDNEFLHECMRVVHTTFLLLLIYCFNSDLQTLALASFLHNGKSGMEQRANNDDKVIFSRFDLKYESLVSDSIRFDFGYRIKMSSFI